jgi:FAD-linked sulfhydryl oxidase
MALLYMDCTEDVCKDIHLASIPTFDSDVITCPPDRADLGRAGWTFLHSTAAHYPDKPTEADKGHYQTFFTLLKYVYPCRSCAAHFGAVLEDDPPQ